MEPPRQCHALFDHQGLQRDPAPARSRERTTHPDARRGERPQERSFVGGLLHERHRPRRQRPPNGNGVGRMAFVDHLHIRRQDRSGRTGGRDGRRACRRQDQNEDRRRSPDLRTGLLVLLRHVRPQTRRTAFRRGIQAHRNLQPGVYHHALGIPLRRRLRHHLLARRHGTERRRGESRGLGRSPAQPHGTDQLPFREIPLPEGFLRPSVRRRDRRTLLLFHQCRRQHRRQGR